MQNKKLVGIEINHNSNGINLFLTFLPHEYQHIHIPRDNHAEVWLSAEDIWEIVQNNQTTKL